MDKFPVGKVFKSCAVVGSSGLLKSYKLGVEIDNHEAIFRFNSDPTKSFEEHVGKKTTIRLTNEDHWGFFEGSEDVIVPLYSRVALEALIRLRSRLGMSSFFSFTPDFLQYVSDAFDFIPSVHLFGVTLALHKCAKLSLYGFQVLVFPASRSAVSYRDIC